MPFYIRRLHLESKVQRYYIAKGPRTVTQGQVLVGFQSQHTSCDRKAGSHVRHLGAHRALGRSAVLFEPEFTNLKNGAWDFTGRGNKAYLLTKLWSGSLLGIFAWGDGSRWTQVLVLPSFLSLASDPEILQPAYHRVLGTFQQWGGRSLQSGYLDGGPSHCRGLLYETVSQLEKPLGTRGPMKCLGFGKITKACTHWSCTHWGCGWSLWDRPCGSAPGGTTTSLSTLSPSLFCPYREGVGTVFFCRGPLPSRTHLFPTKTALDRHIENIANIYCSWSRDTGLNIPVGLRPQV